MSATYITLRIKKDALVTECLDLLEELKKHPVVSCTKLNVKLEKIENPIKREIAFLGRNSAAIH